MVKTIHHSTEQLLTKDIKIIIGDAVKAFHKNNLCAAPAAELVGVLTGYNLITTTENCGGYCNYIKKVIAYNNTNTKDDVYKTRTSKLPFNMNFWERRTMLHEMGHAIQADAGIFAKDKLLLSWKLHMEHQCESIAYKLHTLCYGAIDQRYFDHYTAQDDIDFLKQWYGDHIQIDI